MSEGEKMYRSFATGDFYGQGWFDEASKDALKATEEVWVFTEKELIATLKEAWAAGIDCCDAGSDFNQWMKKEKK